MSRAIRDLIEEAEKERKEVDSQIAALAASMKAETRRNTELYLRLQSQRNKLAERIHVLRKAGAGA
jgi:uncharacterized protein involved in exopolysaccharide biosynthesis